MDFTIMRPGEIAKLAGGSSSRPTEAGFLSSLKASVGSSLALHPNASELLVKERRLDTDLQASWRDGHEHEQKFLRTKLQKRILED